MTRITAAVLWAGTTILCLGTAARGTSDEMPSSISYCSLLSDSHRYKQKAVATEAMVGGNYRHFTQRLLVAKSLDCNTCVDLLALITVPSVCRAENSIVLTVFGPAPLAINSLNGRCLTLKLPEFLTLGLPESCPDSRCCLPARFCCTRSYCRKTTC